MKTAKIILQIFLWCIAVAYFVMVPKYHRRTEYAIRVAKDAQGLAVTYRGLAEDAIIQRDAKAQFEPELWDAMSARHKDSINRIYHRGYGECGKCKRTWDVAEEHTTRFFESEPFKPVISEFDAEPTNNIYRGVVVIRTDSVTTGKGCFALCERCWTDLKTPLARLPYYRELVDSWSKGDSEWDKYWPQIKAAVLSGK